MAAKRSTGLGRGLDALLGEASLKPADSEQPPLTLPIERVEVCSTQPRKNFDEEALETLADSIRRYGILQPLTVRAIESGYYQIIAGERRWRAARLAGLREVPVHIIEADDQKAAELMLVENLQREDLDPIEEATGFQTLIEQFGLTQEEASERVGRSRSAVANSLRLLGLTPEVREMLVQKRLSAGHARAILPLKGALQLKAAQTIEQQELSVRQAEALAKRLLSDIKPKDPKPADGVDYAAEAAKALSNAMGRGVKIVTGRKKGRIELEYYDTEDLNQLIDALAEIKAGGKGNHS